MAKQRVRLRSGELNDEFTLEIMTRKLGEHFSLFAFVSDGRFFASSNATRISSHTSPSSSSSSLLFHLFHFILCIHIFHPHRSNA